MTGSDHVDIKGLSNGGGPVYPRLIADFLAAYSFRQEHGGYPAYEGELLPESGGVVRAQHKLLVFVSRVVCEWPPAAKCKPIPALWFLVCSEADDQYSFAVESELVIEALENVHLSRQSPIPAVEAEDPGGISVLAGAPLSLAMSPVQVEAPKATEPRLPAGGIRFELRETRGEESPPACSFTFAGLVPFLALSDALREDHCRTPKTFAEELDKLSREIEEQ